MKRIAKYLRRNSVGNYFVTVTKLFARGFFRTSGWSLSVWYGLPIDRDKCEIPWFTYPAIEFLKERIKNEFSIFEFGSGNSTIWFSQRAQKVTSVEHDLRWKNIMKEKFLNYPNVSCELHPVEKGEYANAIKEYINQFHIVVIDGVDRVNCSFNAINALKANGVIIWDNSDREECGDGYSFLISNGFRRLDFWGLGPINSYEWCTSIFYRGDNCLRI
jgi:hypothetical protein